MLQQAEQRGWPAEFVQPTESRYWRPEVSRVFHGRDRFAPVCAHLANGVPLENFGPRFTDPVRLPPSPVTRTASGLRGEVAVVVRHFGNPITNLHVSDLPDWSGVTVRVRGAEMRGLVRAFGERPPGELVALIGSDDERVIAEVNGHAGDRLGAQVGDAVDVVAGQQAVSPKVSKSKL